MSCMYNAVEYFEMLDALRKEHRTKLNVFKSILDENKIHYSAPPASPKNDGAHLAEFSYKWAAIHAGLGFIGKNDVFVHEAYAQRVRISCLLIDYDAPVFAGEITKSKCGVCNRCVEACPHNFISGANWLLCSKKRRTPQLQRMC